MAFSDYAKNSMLDALGTTITASLHTGDPGATGTANEVSGGGYARQNGTWRNSGLNADGTAGTPGVKNCQSASQPQFNVPACTVRFVGWWAGSNFLGSQAVTNEVFGAPGTYTLTAQSFSLT